MSPTPAGFRGQRTNPPCWVPFSPNVASLKPGLPKPCWFLPKMKHPLNATTLQACWRGWHLPACGGMARWELGKKWVRHVMGEREWHDIFLSIFIGVFLSVFLLACSFRDRRRHRGRGSSGRTTAEERGRQGEAQDGGHPEGRRGPCWVWDGSSPSRRTSPAPRSCGSLAFHRRKWRPCCMPSPHPSLSSGPQLVPLSRVLCHLWPC